MPAKQTTSTALVTRCKNWAECIDQVRLIPRLIAAGYGYIVWRTWEWATSLPDLTQNQAIFAAAVFGMTGFIFRFYYGIASQSDSKH